MNNIFLKYKNNKETIDIGFISLNINNSILSKIKKDKSFIFNTKEEEILNSIIKNQYIQINDSIINKKTFSNIIYLNHFKMDINVFYPLFFSPGFIKKYGEILNNIKEKNPKNKDALKIISNELNYLDQIKKYKKIKINNNLFFHGNFYIKDNGSDNYLNKEYKIKNEIYINKNNEEFIINLISLLEKLNDNKTKKFINGIFEKNLIQFGYNFYQKIIKGGNDFYISKRSLYNYNYSYNGLNGHNLINEIDISTILFKNINKYFYTNTYNPTLKKISIIKPVQNINIKKIYNILLKNKKNDIITLLNNQKIKFPKKLKSFFSKSREIKTDIKNKKIYLYNFKGQKKFIIDINSISNDNYYISKTLFNLNLYININNKEDRNLLLLKKNFYSIYIYFMLLDKNEDLDVFYCLFGLPPIKNILSLLDGEKTKERLEQYFKERSTYSPLFIPIFYHYYIGSLYT